MKLVEDGNNHHSRPVVVVVVVELLNTTSLDAVGTVGLGILKLSGLDDAYEVGVLNNFVCLDVDDNTFHCYYYSSATAEVVVVVKVVVVVGGGGGIDDDVYFVVDNSFDMGVA